MSHTVYVQLLNIVLLKVLRASITRKETTRTFLSIAFSRFFAKENWVNGDGP